MRHAVLLFIGLLTACAPTTSRTTTTAAVVQPRESVAAHDQSEAIGSILSGDPHRALELTNAEKRESAWRDYVRGVALADLKRPDDAAEAFDAAARLFLYTPDGAHGRSIAIWAKARAYHDAYRCDDAAAAYRAYAAFVGASHPDDAAMALDYARDCMPR